MSNLKSLPEDLQAALENPQFYPPGAMKEVILQIGETLGVVFPADYVEFLSETDGAEFGLGETSLSLWKIHDVLAENVSFVADEDFPFDFLKIFGSNGGAEKLAFDVRANPPEIVIVPHYKPVEADILAQGSQFVEFLRRVKRNQLFET